MRAASLFTWVCFGTALAISVPRRKRSEPAILGRDEDLDDYDIFPFPANQSTIVDASTEPSESPPQDLTVTEDVGVDRKIPRYFYNHECSDAQKQVILQSWEEARLLQKAQTDFVDGYSYNIPHTQWLGKDWNSSGSWIPWKWNFRKLIGNNFKRLRALFNDEAVVDDKIYWLCNDRYNKCNNADWLAYSWDSEGERDLDGTILGANHFTVFCPVFYSYPSLTDVVNAHLDDTHGQKVMENFELNRGQIMFHELYHYGVLVSSPRTTDYSVGAENVWNLAKKKGTNWAYVNADSYALDALAIFVQQQYSSAMSPVPYKELAAFDAEAAAAVPEPEEIVYPTPLTLGPEGPPGWVPPELTDSEPSEDEWEEVFPNGEPPVTDPEPEPEPEPEPAPPLADENDCHGISGDYWVEERDVAAGNVEDFCAQSEKTVTYNADSANELELSVRKLDDDTLGPDDAPYCVDRFMNAVIDGCDGDDPDNNPNNYKYGSTLTTGDGWEYKMTPLNEHVDNDDDDDDDGENDDGDSDLPGPDACPVSRYPGAAGFNEIPAWMEDNICSKVCPGGEFGLCPIVDSDAPEPRTGVCQCTSVSQECIDDYRYTCWSPETP